MSFQQIIQKIEDIKNCYQENLNALQEDHKRKITLSDSSSCEGSINLDTCVMQQYPNANRWDYIFAYKGKVYYVEFHPATTHGISDILKKLEWLKRWLNKKENKELRKRNAENPYHWIASGNIKTLPRARQHKQAAKQGILPKKNLSLDY